MGLSVAIMCALQSGQLLNVSPLASSRSREKTRYLYIKIFIFAKISHHINTE